MHQDEILPSYAGLREADKPNLLTAAGAQVLLYPRNELLGHKAFIMQIWIVRVIRIPRTDRE